ncbi:hypothetical protein DBR39_13695 [Chryseobacterium sp. KBW03]|uniref:phage virion morphogenesis protein n=1 Tax=Chryseobacterium sp. KBW03 TaxID=2153362 RepID=UPI000F5AE33C|nr:phage virion morphogenesis protein [Chryseobacterium sp. KBW03]RQO37936.1 hypothetical protein DBR39_13695 [Chryseobacterium sp. KBW03]
MTPEQIIQRKALELKNYTENILPGKQANTILRFVNGNFRAQGWQGTYFKKWKPSKKKKGSILIKSGRLRAGTTVNISKGQVTVQNKMPYAAIHNEGFKGKMVIGSFTRNKYSKTKVGTGKLTKTGKERQKTVSYKSGESKVKTHSRRVNMPRRQFMPTAKRQSVALNRAITKMIENDIKKIMK